MRNNPVIRVIRVIGGLMGDFLKKVQPGDRLKISARTFNTFIDAALAHLNSSRNIGGGGSGRNAASPGVNCLVQNKTGSDLAEMSVVGLGAPIFGPTDDEKTATFKRQVGFKGETPALADHTGRFAILLEPLAKGPDEDPTNGAIGVARIAGVCAVKVNIADAGHEYADVADGQTAYLASGPTGSAQILWAEAGTSVKWAVIRFGVADAGLPVGTIESQLLRWDNTAEAWIVLDPPAIDGKKYVLTITDRVFAYIETGPFECTPP